MLKTIEAQVLKQATPPALKAEFAQYDFERLHGFCLLIYIASIGIWLLFNLIVSFPGKQGFTLYSMAFLAALAIIAIVLAFTRKVRHFQWLNLVFVLIIGAGIRLVIEGLPLELRPDWLIIGASSMLYSASVLPLRRWSFFATVVLTWVVLDPFIMTQTSVLELKGAMLLIYALFLTALTLYSFIKLRQAKLHTYIMSKLLLEQAYNDTLTGIPNRRSFMARAGEQLAAQPREHDHYLAMIDVDNFKTVNDLYGHDSGDEVLKRVAADIRTVMAGFDYARLGGEEFAVYLCGVRRSDVEQLAERLCQVVRQAPARHPVTISIGLARVEDSDSLNQALVKADKALYQSKHTGKDRYTFHP
ncbi:GGDEF domain-containing protein [Pseudomonas chlororaphis]|uniref:GGDEF domain-containing protein n=1 Tax=Pseudomonas chlororaphis TaxID=587753 RepID=UPI0003D2BBDA|nr:GGDEF domain-containing protein [Pseudomonas chlororaphis]AZD30414.1 diguanylate cyclase (GGDEF domain) [Pseudomonas chlororaphis]ETD38919.1 diguanylate cyclase [Pseudomonas chlororaphis subsp. aurantiaca PB-St2]QFS55796.1 diguanylate cyclase [Pseudomonas chlororaphis subsp. aurantiaca]